MGSEDYRERERLSWAEIDKRRDRSSHTRKDRTEHPAHEDKRAMSRYKEKLEDLFNPEKKVVPKEHKEHADELKALREASDRSVFVTLADAYLAAYGWPESWEDLENFLRHRDPAVLREAIGRMEAIVDAQSEI